jgi:hypothetical protein
VISFRARRRQVVRQSRRDQIRREVREAIDLIARCEAGEPEALRQAEENGRILADYSAPAEADYPEPLDCDDSSPAWPGYARHLEAVAAGEEPCYFGMTPERAREELARLEAPEPEPDPGPSWLQRPGESDRQYHHRTGRPDLAERRAALLLAHGHWDAGNPLPGAIREALCAMSLAPRLLRRILFGIWERGGLARRGDRWGRIRKPRELVRFWSIDPRELPLGWPGDDGHGLEACPLRGPPAGVAALEAPVISP